MKTIFNIVLAIAAALILLNCHGQKTHSRIMFYNVENLFDTEDDPRKNDNEFLPEGTRRWTDKRYFHKLVNIYKVITAVGEPGMPDIVGLCEVENRKCIEDIIEQTPLKKHGYKIVHFESPDRRGIDVAMLYREKYFTVEHSAPINISFPGILSRKRTRDILYVKGKLRNKENIHLYINHWPSKYGGAKASDTLRCYVASILRSHVDSVLASSPNANIIITGDLNDETDAQCVTKCLNAQNDFNTITPNKLYNLSHYLYSEKKEWSHKYRSHYGIIDQIIVSGNLLNNKNSIYTSKEFTQIFHSPFLQEKDEKHKGEKPFRTYLGYTYHGGFSDHLPVYLDLHFK